MKLQDMILNPNDRDERKMRLRRSRNFSRMKKNIRIIFSALLIFCSVISSAQHPAYSDSLHKSRWNIGITYWNALSYDGYVRVREWEWTGDKLSLADDLGMDGLRSAGIFVSYRVKKNNVFIISFERFSFSGNAVPPNNIWYNATHLKGTDGLSINKSWLARGEFRFEKSYHPENRIHAVSITGLLCDGLKFYIDGTVLPDTYMNEPHEGWADQALPFPFLGLRLNAKLCAHSSLSLETAGTHVPLFKSFYTEGGNMYLSYSAADVSINYFLTKGKFRISGSYLYRMIEIYGDSREDTNDFFMTASGIRFTAGYYFKQIF